MSPKSRCLLTARVVCRNQAECFPEHFNYRPEKGSLQSNLLCASLHCVEAGKENVAPLCHFAALHVLPCVGGDVARSKKLQPHDFPLMSLAVWLAPWLPVAVMKSSANRKLGSNNAQDVGWDAFPQCADSASGQSLLAIILKKTPMQLTASFLHAPLRNLWCCGYAAHCKSRGFEGVATVYAHGLDRTRRLAGIAFAEVPEGTKRVPRKWFEKNAELKFLIMQHFVVGFPIASGSFSLA